MTNAWTVTTAWPLHERARAEAFLTLLRDVAQEPDARLDVHICASPGGVDVDFVGECHEIPQEVGDGTDITVTFTQVDS